MVPYKVVSQLRGFLTRVGPSPSRNVLMYDTLHIHKLVTNWDLAKDMRHGTSHSMPLQVYWFGRGGKKNMARVLLFSKYILARVPTTYVCMYVPLLSSRFFGMQYADWPVSMVSLICPLNAAYNRITDEKTKPMQRRTTHHPPPITKYNTARPLRLIVATFHEILTPLHAMLEYCVDIVHTDSNRN